MISNNIESEHDRVNLIKTVTNIFMTKQHIRLNPKRLYQADGYAVKEILKLIVVLVQGKGYILTKIFKINIKFLT